MIASSLLALRYHYGLIAGFVGNESVMIVQCLQESIAGQSFGTLALAGVWNMGQARTSETLAIPIARAGETPATPIQTPNGE